MFRFDYIVSIKLILYANFTRIFSLDQLNACTTLSAHAMMSIVYINSLQVRAEERIDNIDGMKSFSSKRNLDEMFSRDFPFHLVLAHRINRYYIELYFHYSSISRK